MIKPVLSIGLKDLSKERVSIYVCIYIFSNPFFFQTQITRNFQMIETTKIGSIVSCNLKETESIALSKLENYIHAVYIRMNIFPNFQCPYWCLYQMILALIVSEIFTEIR